MIGSEKPNEARSEWYNGYKPVAVPWEGPGGGGGPASPLIFRPNWGPKGRKEIFGRPLPLSLSEGLDLPL